MLGCTTKLSFTSNSQGGMGGVASAPATEGGDPGFAGAAGQTPLGEPTFQEECEAPLDASRWRTEMIVGDSSFRSWGGRADWMADENVSVADGYCVITAENRASGDRQYTSGVMSTGGLFEQRYGRFEARIKAPAGTGLWPIFWLRALDGWPPAINVADMSGDDPAQLVSGLWFSADNATQADTSELALAWSEDFHVYAVTWSPDSLRYEVDGSVWFETSTGLETFDVPLHPVINLSLFDGSTGIAAPDSTTPWPAKLYVDWVRVYGRMP